MGSIKILNPGLLSSIQDSGRFGYQQYGMPVAGAMDLDSLQFANWCVGNDLKEACIEATLLGPIIEFQIDTYIAICGADIPILINNFEVEQNCNLKVKEGDVLSFGPIQSGCRIYIAFAGGLSVPELMQSKSTYLRGKFGGFEGRALAVGDGIRVDKVNFLPIKSIPQDLVAEYKSETQIRVTTGADITRFTQEGIMDFLCSEYTISPQSDRMGYRLAGKKITHVGGADIISSGIGTGTIQVPGHGEPIIMMSDHQTVGGYTKIANVISVDLPLLGQMKPGDKIRFKEVSLDLAQNLLIERRNKLSGLFER